MPLRFHSLADCHDPWCPAYLDIVNQAMPTFAMSLAEAQDMDTLGTPEKVGWRWLGILDDEPVVGLGYSLENPTPGEPPTYRIRLRALPGTEEAVLQEGMKFLEQERAHLGPRKETYFHLSNTPECRPVVERFGFEMTQVNSFTELTLADWQPPEAPACQATIRKIQCTATGSGPDDMAYYELHDTLLQDVPMPTPYTQEPPEEFFKYFGLEVSRNTHIWVAEVEGRMVGMTELHNNSYFEDMMNTGLTGVRRDYRRKGIASALKRHALCEAKKWGKRIVTTDNEESNPMLGLNHRLGFRPTLDGLSYVRVVSA